THKTDNGSRDVFILGVRPSATKICLGKTPEIKRHTQIFQIRAGQVTWPGQDQSKSCDAVDVVANIGCKTVEKILWLARVAVAARDRDHLVRMGRDRYENRR